MKILNEMRMLHLPLKLSHSALKIFNVAQDGENYLKFDIYGKPSEDMPWFAVGKVGGPIQ